MILWVNLTFKDWMEFFCYVPLNLRRSEYSTTKLFEVVSRIAVLIVFLEGNFHITRCLQWARKWWPSKLDNCSTNGCYKWPIKMKCFDKFTGDLAKHFQFSFSNGRQFQVLPMSDFSKPICTIDIGPYYSGKQNFWKQCWEKPETYQLHSGCYMYTALITWIVQVHKNQNW